MLVRFDNIGALGVNRDGLPHELPATPAGGRAEPVFAWSDALNVRFREMYAERFGGEAAIHGTPDFAPYAVFPTQGVNGRYWVYCGLTDINAVINSAHTEITRTSGDYTGTAADRWNGGVLAGALILNNGVDKPQFWGGDTGTEAADLTNWPANTRAKVIRPFKNYLVALNITESSSNFPSRVLVSHPADPGTLPSSWDHTDATKDVYRGEGALASTPGKIIDGLALGDMFMIYKEDSAFAMEFIGGDFIWRFRRVYGVDGMLAQQCAVEIQQGAHAVLTQGDIVLNQGYQGARSLIDARMRRWLFNNLDSDNYEKCFAVTNERQKEAWFCFPETGNTACNLALIWNWEYNTTQIREVPDLIHANSGTIVFAAGNSWAADTETWDEDDTTWNQYEYTQATPRVMMASAADTALYLADSTRSFNGTNISASMERTGLSFGAPEKRKYCKEVRPRFEANLGTEISIYVGTQETLQDTVTWSDPVTYTVGTDLKADFDVSGRYLAVKFESSTLASWRLKGFEVDVEVLGSY